MGIPNPKDTRKDKEEGTVTGKISYQLTCRWQRQNLMGFFFKILFLSHFHTQCGARTYNPRIKSSTLHQPSQPGAPSGVFSRPNLQERTKRKVESAGDRHQDRPAVSDQLRTARSWENPLRLPLQEQGRPQAASCPPPNECIILRGPGGSFRRGGSLEGAPSALLTEPHEDLEQRAPPAPPLHLARGLVCLCPPALLHAHASTLLSLLVTFFP